MWWLFWVLIAITILTVGTVVLIEVREVRTVVASRKRGLARFTHSTDNERWTCNTCRAIFYGTDLQSYAIAHDCVANLRSKVDELTNGAARLFGRVEKLESWHPRDAFQSARLNTIEAELKTFNGSRAGLRLETVEHGMDLHRARIEELERVTGSQRTAFGIIGRRLTDLESSFVGMSKRRKR